MAKQKCPECPKGAPKWMTTFSDMTTLLLTFFVLLLSMANFDKVKIEQVFGVLTGSAGILKSDKMSEMSEPNVVTKSALKESQNTTTEQVVKNLQDYVKSQNLEKMVSIVKTDKGLSIRVMDSVLFATGSVELQSQSIPIIKRIATLVQDTPYYINIEGHTDDIPAGVRSFNNWKLSTGRAVSVLEQFIKLDIDPVRLSASGFGEFHPLLPNITPENRARNRRVEINLTTTEFAESGKSMF